jgi:hypothetical protein
MLRLSAIWVGALAISLFEVESSVAQQSSPQPPSTTAPTPPELPDAPSVYVPLSGHDKFKLFLRRTYSPYTFRYRCRGSDLGANVGAVAGLRRGNARLG